MLAVAQPAFEFWPEHTDLAVNGTRPLHDRRTGITAQVLSARHSSAFTEVKMSQPH
jgi:hypothetical protein